MDTTLLQLLVSYSVFLTLSLMFNRNLFCFCLLFSLLFFTIHGKAQQISLPADGNTTGSTGSVSYSIGQVFYTMNTGPTASSSMGVQQPYEISVLASVADINPISLTCSLFPNPAADYVILKTNGDVSTSLIYQLYDISGKLLESKAINGTETTISMGAYPVSVYFLKVTSHNTEVETFKIIKN